MKFSVHKLIAVMLLYTGVLDGASADEVCDHSLAAFRQTKLYSQPFHSVTRSVGSLFLPQGAESHSEQIFLGGYLWSRDAGQAWTIGAPPTIGSTEPTLSQDVELLEQINNFTCYLLNQQVIEDQPVLVYLLQSKRASAGLEVLYSMEIWISKDGQRPYRREITSASFGEIPAAVKAIFRPRASIKTWTYQDVRPPVN